MEDFKNDESCEIKEIKLHQEEENYLSKVNSDRVLSNFFDPNLDQNTKLKNTIASFIDGDETLYITLEEQDCIGIRSVIVKVFIDDIDETKDFMSNSKIKEKRQMMASLLSYNLAEEGFSVSSAFKKNSDSIEFRCSPIPIREKGESNEFRTTD
jgi:hypothetical protein